MDEEFDSVVEGLTEQQLKDTVCRNVREISRLKEDGKAESKARREVIKGLEQRNDDLLSEMEKRKSISQF